MSVLAASVMISNLIVGQANKKPEYFPLSKHQDLLAEIGPSNFILVFAENTSKTLPDVSKDKDAYIGHYRRNGFKVLREEALIVADERFPGSKLSRLARFLGDPAPTFSTGPMPLSRDFVKNGKVTLKTETDKVIPLQAMADMDRFSKPLRIAPYYLGAGQRDRTFQIALNIKDLPEVEFLRALAKALGAKFRQTPKEFRIDFDGTDTRKRLGEFLSNIAAKIEVPKPSEAQAATSVASVTELTVPALNEFAAQVVAGPSISLDRLRLFQAVINNLTEAQFEEFLSFSGTTVPLSLSKYPGLQPLVGSILNSMNMSVSMTSRHGATTNVPVLQALNPRNPGKITLFYGGQIQFEGNIIPRNQAEINAPQKVNVTLI